MDEIRKRKMETYGKDLRLWVDRNKLSDVKVHKIYAKVDEISLKDLELLMERLDRYSVF